MHLQPRRRLQLRRRQDLLRQERQRHQGAVRRARAARRHRLHLLAQEPQAEGVARLQNVEHAFGKYIISNQPMSEERLKACRRKWG
jgi:hypothetical protein